MRKEFPIWPRARPGIGLADPYRFVQRWVSLASASFLINARPEERMSGEVRGAHEAVASSPPMSRDGRGSSWPRLSGVRVALIDDNVDTRVMVAESPQHCGAIVTMYEAGETALGALLESVPDVLICDLCMPSLDGLELMLQLRGRSTDHGGRVPLDRDHRVPRGL